MGAEVAIAVAAIGAATTVYATTEQQRQAKKSASAQKEASDISAAQQKNDEMNQRRQQIRQQRIRAAQIEQGAANQGVSDSSGELGSLSALSTNVSNNLATLSGKSLASSGIYSATQRAANAQQAGQTAAAYGQIGGMAMNLAAPKAAEGLSKLFQTELPDIASDTGSTGTAAQSNTTNLF